MTQREREKESYYEECYECEKGTSLGLNPRPPAWEAEAIANRIPTSSRFECFKLGTTSRKDKQSKSK